MTNENMKAVKTEIADAEIVQEEKNKGKDKASAVAKKMEALKEFIVKAKISGIQMVEIDEKNKVLRSNLLIEGQSLPMFIVLNNTVYSYIQVHLITVKPEKVAECLTYLNELNEQFSMLKYFINNGGNIVLTCSVPASDDGFEPALMIALIDQVKKHLEEHYAELMKKVWQD